MNTPIENNLFRAVFADLGVNISGMNLVETSHGFNVMTKIEYLDAGIWKPGVLGAIGENAKTPNGSRFTAFAVGMPNDVMAVKTLHEIRHAPEAGLPKLWIDALHKGWQIKHCSCSCGGNYAWLEPSSYGGADRMFGCVCHNDPKL